RPWAPSSSTRRTWNGCEASPPASCSLAPSMPEPLPPPSTVGGMRGRTLTRNWLHFGRLLRGLGFDAGPARMLPFLRTLTAIDMSKSDDLQTAVRVHFGRRRDELARLDRALYAVPNSPADVDAPLAASG